MSDKWINELIQNKQYNRAQLYDLYIKSGNSQNENSFKWEINNLVSQQKLIRIQRNTYMLPSDAVLYKNEYKPDFTEELIQIKEIVTTAYPKLKMVCFESVQLNEFLNHMIANNTYFVFVDRYATNYIYDALVDAGYKNVLLNPSTKEWDSYWRPGTIVVSNLISDAPINNSIPNSMSIEALLVDLISDRGLKNLYEKNELAAIFSTAFERYRVDTVKMLRYAGRRGKTDIIRNYIGGLTIANAR